MKRVLPLFVVALCALAQAQNPNGQPGPCTSRAAGGNNQATLPAEATDAMRQARQAAGEGKLDEAITLYQRAHELAPNAPQPYLGAGTALDLKGDYAGARQQFAKAIDAAQGQGKIQALKSMAISYAFTNDGKDAEKYEKMAFDQQIGAPYYYDAGETADELARIYLEANDPGDALKWYRTGYETGIKEPNISAACNDLWQFRWENAQARVAARRGQKEEAEKHLAAAKAIFDKGSNPDQARFVPYLTGYVAFYLGDYKTALADLQNADQRDPFILLLEAEAHEKLGDGQSAELYRKIVTFSTHNPPNAFARPIAQRHTGGGA
ncbi:MAG TPA: tetratricopeptide repeat protein [Terriglobales bacterium]|nr:tetratricopeptide repeat protein [Terriglobales bacterium]